MFKSYTFRNPPVSDLCLIKLTFSRINLSDFSILKAPPFLIDLLEWNFDREIYIKSKFFALMTPPLI